MSESAEQGGAVGGRPDPGHGPRRLIFLGTGTSTGVPAFGCDCAVCTSGTPRNQRTRPSVLLETPGGNVIIDTSPEMRLQLLRERVRQVHAIVYTHAHADHLFGLDDARLFPRSIGGPVPVYCEEEVELAIRQSFPYAFNDQAKRMPSGGVPQLDFQRIEVDAPFEVRGETLIPMRLHHGRFRVLGYRIGDLAYCTDVSKIPDQSLAQLQNLDVLILDALRFQPHPTHFSLAQALEVVAQLKPRRTWLTHLSHDYDHDAVEATLPPGVALAYDGLAIGF